MTEALQSPKTGRGRPPGINAKLRAAPVNPMVRRVERFALQSVARDILPTSRTAKCLRIRAYDKDVQVWKSKNHKTASYAGLQTCGSVWVCPVCGAKVVERRRGEIQQAMAMHRACGGEVHLLTLTVPHTRFNALDDLLERQGKALQGFLRDFTVKAVFKEMGYIGQIRGYETTHGRKGTNNGWHPHFHFLQFVMVKGTLRSSWTGKRGSICGGMPTAKRPDSALHRSSMALTCGTVVLPVTTWRSGA